MCSIRPAWPGGTSSQPPSLGTSRSDKCRALFGLQETFLKCRQRHGLPDGVRLHKHRCHKDQQFTVRLLRAVAAEEMPEYRQIAKARNLVENLSRAIVDEAGDRKTLAFAKIHFRLGLARADRRNQESLNRESIRVVQRTHLRP